MQESAIDTRAHWISHRWLWIGALFALLWIADLLFGASAASAEEYVVRPGDTLAAIARRYEMSYRDLARANNIADPNRIRVGQRLTVPWDDLPVQGIPAAYYAQVHQWDARTEYYAKYYHVDPDLIRRIMWIESKGYQWARSSSGAIGLMQIMPSWFRTGENPWNSWANIGKGTYILRRGYDAYHSWKLAVAWYAYGPLARFGGNVPTTYTSLVFTR